MSEELNGSIERLTYHNEENGFVVAQVKLRNRRDLVAVVGRAASIKPGEVIQAQGEWVRDKQHGLQFKASDIKITEPSSLSGIEKFLASGAIKGIGEHFAKLLVNKFALNIFETIENSPELLLKVPGIGAHKQRQIIQGWSNTKQIREIMLFLHQHGISTNKAHRIYKRYGTKAIALIQEDPYRLVYDIHGIGFKTADELAIKMGIPEHSIARAKAGVHYCMQNFSAKGHCATTNHELILQVCQELNIPSELAMEAIAALLGSELVAVRISGEECLMLYRLYKAELEVANHLSRLQNAGNSIEISDLSAQIAWVQANTGLQLSKEQKAAVEQALSDKICIITGGPGVGKTTTINSIIRILSKQNYKIHLCAPTGRAAKRLSESTQMSAITIHRLLELDPQNYGFKRNQSNPLDTHFLVVDEVSMVDISLMQSLLRAIPDNAHLLLVGDIDQLPSVGPGSVLGDLIKAGIPTAELKEIFRQAAQSQIVVNAHCINRGYFPKKETEGESDFYCLKLEEPELISSKLIELVSKRIPAKFGFCPKQDIQVLTPTNKSLLGAQSLNIALQQELNPNPGPSVQKYGTSFAVGDKVMQIVNNYDKNVFNGDIGLIAELGQETMQINFEGKLIEYEFSELDELSLAYAITIHKSQGSEYPAVVIPLATQHFTLLQRNLLYTAITRGKKLVILLAQTKALAMAIKNDSGNKRLTHLVEAMKEL